jgi:hypothetical protein
MKNLIFFIASVFVFLSLSNCALIGSGFARITTDFKKLPSNDRILYETGAGALVEEADRHLSQAVTAVESRQYGTFKEPFKVYVFATAKSFSDFSGVSEEVKGAGLKDEVFLSGKLLNTIHEVAGMLTHELSHVQLIQTLGTIKFNRNLPQWFREGLAIYVANGGGATNASEAEAIEQFLQGKHFSPETEGALINLKIPGSSGLNPSIFYRQSGMFVHYMARNYPTQFEKFLRELQEGKEFEAYFPESFKLNVDEMLQAFIIQLK